MVRLRVSAINFLNTAPLMWDSEQGEPARELSRHFQVGYTVPSQCAEQLKTGAADIGIIPVAAYTTIPDLVVIPGVSIPAHTTLRPILPTHNVPVHNLPTLATPP